MLAGSCEHTGQCAQLSLQAPFSMQATPYLQQATEQQYADVDGNDQQQITDGVLSVRIKLQGSWVSVTCTSVTGNGRTK